MRKIMISTLLLSAFAICLQAQDASKMTTIKGCLSYSRQHYVLTDSTGMAHQLSGYANKLKAHVGHEVEITGTEATHTTDTTVQGGAPSAKETAVLKVSSIKHIAETCTAGQ